MDRRWLILPLALGFAGLGTAALHPGELAPETAFTGGHVVAVGIARQELLAGNLGPHTGLAGAPAGVDARSLLWPLNLVALGLGPIVSVNLLFALTPTLNALGAARLGTALGLDRRGGTVLALLVAFNPWVRATLANGQLEQALIGGAAWMWAAMIGGGALEIGLVSLGVALATPHVALAGMFGVFLARGRPLRLLATLPGLALAYAWHAPGFDPSIPHLFAPFGSGAGTAGAPAAKHALFAWELVWPAPPPPVKFRPVLHMGYLGLALLGGALLGLRRGRLALGGVLLLAVLLAIGGLPLDAVPLLSRSATPYRFVMAALLAAAALAAPGRWALLLVPILWIESFVVDRRPWPMPAQDFSADGPRPLAPGLVLDLPGMGPGCREVSTHHLVEARRHGQPLPSILRDGADAFPGRVEAARRLDRALRASPCSDDLGPAIEAFAPVSVIAHTHLPCRLPLQARACLETSLGPPSGEDARGIWWTGLHPNRRSID